MVGSRRHLGPRRYPDATGDGQHALEVFWFALREPSRASAPVLAGPNGSYARPSARTCRVQAQLSRSRLWDRGRPLTPEAALAGRAWDRLRCADSGRCPNHDRTEGVAPLAVIGDAARIILLEEQDGGLCRSRYDQVGRTVPRGPQMSPTLDGTLADPQQIS